MRRRGRAGAVRARPWAARGGGASTTDEGYNAWVFGERRCLRLCASPTARSTRQAWLGVERLRRATVEDLLHRRQRAADPLPRRRRAHRCASFATRPSPKAARGPRRAWWDASSRRRPASRWRRARLLPDDLDGRPAGDDALDGARLRDRACPPGEYRMRADALGRRGPDRLDVDVGDSGSATHDLILSRRSALAFTVRTDGNAWPAKLRVVGIPPTRNPRARTRLRQSPAATSCVSADGTGERCRWRRAAIASSRRAAWSLRHRRSSASTSRAARRHTVDFSLSARRRRARACAAWTCTSTPCSWYVRLGGVAQRSRRSTNLAEGLDDDGRQSDRQRDQERADQAARRALARDASARGHPRRRGDRRGRGAFHGVSLDGAADRAARRGARRAPARGRRGVARGQGSRSRGGARASARRESHRLLRKHRAR